LRPARAKKFTRSYLYRRKLGVVKQACHPSYGGKQKMGGLQSSLAWLQKVRPYLQITRTKRAGDMAQVVEHLPSKCKKET
jgi:hypothetical protein